MNLTDGQQEALAMAKRLKAAKRPQVGVIAGVAGSGKTTLLKIVAEELGTPVVIAPTGKAAARVKEAAGIGAMTCHRWMYSPVTDDTTGKVTYNRLPRELLAKGEAGVLVVEEASMVNQEIWDHIWDNAVMLGLKVLCIGDPFQLPPISDNEKEQGFSLLDPSAGIASEYILMDEVLRQAQESNVIRASMALRAGDVMKAIAELPKVKPVDFIDVAARVQAQGGVIICYQNRTRHWCNEGVRVRRRLPTADIAPAEPVLILKNNYGLQVFNGETHTFQRWIEPPLGKHVIYDRWTKTREESRLGLAALTNDEGQEFSGVLFMEELFGRLTASVRAIDTTGEISFPDYPILHANFGYTMTAHKSQGSEWGEVLVAWEPTLRFWGEAREKSLRWAYTSVTRAKEKCSVSMGVTAPRTLP